jgi:hypothetical protein
MLSRLVITVPIALTVTALAGSAPALAIPAPSVSPTVGPAPTTQGIIMRDGGVCDPIRHMGC